MEFCDRCTVAAAAASRYLQVIKLESPANQFTSSQLSQQEIQEYAFSLQHTMQISTSADLVDLVMFKLVYTIHIYTLCGPLQ